MPAAPLLADESVLLQRGEHAVEVVLLDAHRLGHLGDADPGAAAHELERLLGTRSRSLWTPAPAGAFRCPGLRSRTRTGRAAAPRGRGGRRSDARERRSRGLEPVILVDERLQLLEPLTDLPSFVIEKIGHL